MDHKPDDELTDTDSELDTFRYTGLDSLESKIELNVEEHIDSHTESHTESITKFSTICKAHEIADYGDGLFLKLRDCFIEATALTEFSK